MSTTKRARFQKLPALALSLAMTATMFWALSSSADEDLRPTYGRSIPLALLPSRVPAPQGELTLYADYTSGHGESVVLYLINRTDRDITFPVQDGDIYVKLETLSDAGYWERAERHRYSWCGNSYWPQPRLNSEHFFRFLGHSPRNGERRTVRYRMYSGAACAGGAPDPFGMSCFDGEFLKINMFSNSTVGFVSPEDVRHCRGDSMSAAYGSFEVVAELAADPSRPSFGRGEGEGSRSVAIGALRRFGDERALAVLEGLLDDEDERIQIASVLAIARMASKLKTAGALHEKLLNDEDPVIRASAIRGLASLRHVETMVPYVSGLLEESVLEVRDAALSVLFGLARECEEAFELVEELADDPDPDIRRTVELHLRYLDKRRANPEEYEFVRKLWAQIRKRDDL